jgi:hypothetical protein
VLEASGRRRGRAVSALVLGLASGYAVVLAVPWAREFFALASMTPVILATAVGGAAFVLTALWLADARFAPGRAHGAE